MPCFFQGHLDYAAVIQAAWARVRAVDEGNPRYANIIALIFYFSAETGMIRAILINIAGLNVVFFFISHTF